MHTLGKYQIIQELGSGGFATVYEAYDTVAHRRVALKVLHPYWLGDKAFIKRFRREAKAVASLHHPSIVHVYESGEIEGQFYIAMEHLSGRTLSEVLRAETMLPLQRAIPILEQIASALDYAHQRGILHRDIKPSNVILSASEGQVRATLLDFGLVKLLSNSSILTSYGKLVGSPEYMAPEQANVSRRDEVGPAADRYAFGVMAYQMLTGRVPFPGNSPATLNAHESKPVPSPRKLNPALSEAVASTLLKMLAKRPEDRFETAEAFVTQLKIAATEECERKCERLYMSLRQAASEGQWAQVLRLGGQIQALVPGYRDVITRMMQAQQIIAASNREPDSMRQQPRLRWWRWSSVVLVVLLLALGYGYSWPKLRPLKAGAQRTRTPDGIVTVYVPPAQEFLMGTAEWADNVPIHPVSLRGFWLDRTEVTQAQYALCVAAGACAARDDLSAGDHPVVATWDEARVYCRWVGARLPTEAEWEYAARGSRVTYPWGDSPPDGSRLNFCDAQCDESWADTMVDDGYAQSAPVGSFPQGASWCSALDMAGNVWEWVQDWYDPHYYQDSARVNPSGPISGTQKVLRGGSWRSEPVTVQASYRYHGDPNERGVDRGFRCAQDAK